jgi:hypothetical protein
MFSPKFSWNDFFPGTPSTTLKTTEYSSRETPSGNNVYVSNCLFNKCTLTSGNGGALYCISATYFLIESSSFFSCKTNSGRGGAIYFSSSNCLQSVLYSVCGNDCSSTEHGPFASLYIQNTASNKNCVNYSTIARCVSDSSGECYILWLQYGKIYCPSVNMSMNKCTTISGVVFTPFVDANSVTSSSSYSTFADNSYTQQSVIWCNNGGTKYELKSCNILRNIEISGSYGTIFSRGNLMIEDSCILQNTANYIFYQGSSSHTITISNCTVDSNTKYGNVITQKTVTKSFIHGLNHMSTRNCHIEYDSAGYLTAVPYVSHSTKKEVCYTFKNHHQVQISDFFTFNWLFILTFINPNPTGYFMYDSNVFYV